MLDSSLDLGPWSFPSDNPEKAKWANAYDQSGNMSEKANRKQTTPGAGGRSGPPPSW